MKKYSPLRDQLINYGNRIEMTFEEIAKVVGGLPPSAYKYREWWANEVRGSHVQARAWAEAGYEVRDVDLSSGLVVFERTSRGHG